MKCSCDKRETNKNNSVLPKDPAPLVKSRITSAGLSRVEPLFQILNLDDCGSYVFLYFCFQLSRCVSLVIDGDAEEDGGVRVCLACCRR